VSPVTSHIKGDTMDLWQAVTSGIFSLSGGESFIAAIPLFCICATLSQSAILKKYGLTLRKSLGQHILIDDNVAQKITAELGVQSDEGIIEIGPGLGALTHRLSTLARRVVAVEIDGRLASVLTAETTDASNIDIVQHNILKVNFGRITESRPDVSGWKVVGNLPYYITSAILLHLVDARQYFSMAVVTVQDEFARRLVATPGSKDYSSLSIYIQYRFEPKILFTIKPTSFFPRPDVRSAVVRLKVLERLTLDVRDEGLFFQTVRAAFGQRRKTLRRSLRQIPGLTPEIMGELGRISGVDLNQRPENISIEEFASLSNAIEDVAG
jgi:16S rRNA (adenine1518-N6/adenine1519-N6)-dimethyltransferase